MRRLAFILALALGGCVNVPKTTPPPIIVSGWAKCPPKVTYTQAQQNAIAAAIEKLPANSPLIGVVADYHAMRVADDVCLKTNKPGD